MELISIIKGIFKVVGCVGTYDILRRIKERGRCSYGDCEFLSALLTLKSLDRFKILFSSYFSPLFSFHTTCILKEILRN